MRQDDARVAVTATARLGQKQVPGSIHQPSKEVNESAIAILKIVKLGNRTKGGDGGLSSL